MRAKTKERFDVRPTDPWWWQRASVWAFMGGERKSKHCTKRGTHKPVLIDLGRDKRCRVCWQH